MFATIEAELKRLFHFKETKRKWHQPFLAAISIGGLLLLGLYFNQIQYGILASLAGLVILYLHQSSGINRMLTLLSCSFGFMISFTIGIIFSFNPYISSLVLALFAIAVHWLIKLLDVKPPGSFFFILIASIASCMPFNLNVIPLKIGLMGMGAMFACLVGLVYSLIVREKNKSISTSEIIVIKKNVTTPFFESVIIGFFVGFSLLVGKLLQLDNPYWLPISCLAVLQGVSLKHVWSRSFQRILGTFLGLIFAWGLISLNFNAFGVCLVMIVLQFFIEVLIVRNYGLAVVFITPLTIFLAESGSPIIDNPNDLIATRFVDILIGSLIGAVAGWFLYHKKLKAATQSKIRKTTIKMLKKKKRG